MISLEKAKALKEALGYVYGRPDNEFPLGDLLAEIERRGWKWVLRKGYCYVCKDEVDHPVLDNNTEDAVSLALLWILGQEKKANDAPSKS